MASAPVPAPAPAQTFESVIEWRPIPGRGRGMVALRDIAAGERVARFESYCFTLYDDEPSSYPSSKCTECCASCLCWTSADSGCTQLPERCAKCNEGYCSAACKATAARHGHHLCCAALARVAAMDASKYSRYERATACFLLRAFARKRVSQAASPLQPLGRGQWTVEPTFSDALAQCADTLSDERRRGTVERAIKLARLQKGSLIDVDTARTLLHAEPQNCFHLFDSDEVGRRLD